MNKSDIDLLSCLLDGELEDARAQELLARLAHDTALQAEFERLKHINKQYREAVFEIEQEPLSPKLQSLFDTELSGDTAPHAMPHEAHASISFWQLAQQKLAQWLPQPTWARAAMASAVPVVFAIVIMTPGGEENAPNYMQQLSNIVSGESTTVGDITITQTYAFQRQDDSLCKRFVAKTIAHDSDNANDIQTNTTTIARQNIGRDVVACYSQGHWQEVISAAMTVSQEEALYIPASADSLPLDFYMEEQMRGIPLDPQQERELLHKLLPAK